MELNEKVKYLRKTNKLTQEKMAKIIGTKGSNYSRYESGEQSFTIEHIKKISSYFNVSLTYLLDDNPKEILMTEHQFKKLIEAKKIIEEIEGTTK